MKRQVKIGVADHRQIAQEFVTAWKRAERGDAPEEPVERLYFADMITLFETLTPVRLRLLVMLHREGPSSIRSLSQKLHRDYKNVHTDVGILSQAGLIIKDRQDRLTSPWTSIISELTLDSPGLSA
ncbi:MAG: hypothetical protein H7833_00125 [Magnetococcus sp. DMHC-1]|nr:hypothetical protein [Magnetococcales bacterium]